MSEIKTDKPLRIALTGRMRSGKSTIADYLWLKHDFAKVSFASDLKYVADRLFSHLYEPIYEDCPFSEGGRTIKEYRKPRALLQTLGQKMREIDEDVWIKQVEQDVKLAEAWRRTAGVVIDDLRQPNEYEWAKDNGFVIIRVDTDDDVRLERAKRAGDVFKTEDLRHETEQFIDDIQADIDIWNGEGVSEDDLRRKVDEILAEIKAAVK